MENLAKRTWKCLNCDAEFGVGKWTCQDGFSKHRVVRKYYMLNDAPIDSGHPADGGMNSQRDGRTVICNIPPDTKVIDNGTVSYTGGGSVEFIRGRYATDDPEQQHFLDLKGGFCGTYLETDSDEAKDQAQAAWRHAWLSEAQNLSIERMKLVAERQRLENERNELLSQVQKDKRKMAEART